MTVHDLTEKIKAFDTLVNSTIVSDQEETYPILDGIIDPERFVGAKYKILWILKEPYDEFDEELFESLPEFLKDKIKSSTEYFAMRNVSQESNTTTISQETDDLPF